MKLLEAKIRASGAFKQNVYIFLNLN